MDRLIIPAEGVNEILRTSPHAYSMTLLRQWTAASKAGEAKYAPTAIVDIPTDFRDAPAADNRAEGDWDIRWAPNWKSIKSTTVGRIIANNLIFSRSRALREAFPFYDRPWNDKTIAELQQRLIDMRLEGRIDHADMVFAIDRLQWLGYSITAFVAPSMTINTIRAPKKVKQLKAEILKSERGDRIRQGDLTELSAVEKELVEASKKELDGIDPGFDIFASGARGSVG